MKQSHFDYRAVCISIAVAMLAGCGGSQPPTGMPATAAGSVPSAKRSTLLYVVSLVNSFYVVNYATGKARLIVFAPIGSGAGACSDASGDVFIPAYAGRSESRLHGEILEYRHGGQKPVNVLDEGDVVPTSCTVDPTSGNLAVTNHLLASSSGDVAIFPEAQSPPTTYSDPAFSNFIGSTYDNQGNLYIIGRVESNYSYIEIAELPNGSSTFTNITLNQQINGKCVQWDGSDLAVTNPAFNKKFPAEVYRVSVSGSSGTVVGTVKFQGASRRWDGEVSLIAGKNIVLAFRHDLGIYKYPAGGKRLRTILNLGHAVKVGLALSN